MIDESGTDGQSSVLTMAALLAVDLRWAHLEAEWRAMLERHGLDAIHCSQLRHQLGYDEAWVAQLMRDVEAIILRHVPVSVVGVMARMTMIRSTSRPSRSAVRSTARWASSTARACRSSRRFWKSIPGRPGSRART